MIINQTTQKPALILFSGLALIMSSLFSNQASAAMDELKTVEAQAYSVIGEDTTPITNNPIFIITKEQERLAAKLAAEGREFVPEDAPIPLDFRFNANLDAPEIIIPFNPKGFVPDKSDFEAGNIISDYVFLNSDSMTLGEIQGFLEFKGKDCVDGAMPCLKDYVATIPETPVSEKGLCAEIKKVKDASAAEMIYTVAQACGINPQVLLVTIQKEQGLVEASRPSSYMYRAAMGHNCPDGNPSACGNVTGGFWEQLREGAEQKLWYGDPRSEFTYLAVGSTITRPYHPDATCGATSFKLKNRATAALYYYTPYVPNSAALSNMTGRGNDCSAYGNRNFFRMFNEWFGDSRAHAPKGD